VVITGTDRSAFDRIIGPTSREHISEVEPFRTGPAADWVLPRSDYYLPTDRRTYHTFPERWQDGCHRRQRGCTLTPCVPKLLHFIRRDELPGEA
jgi:hypothetical protein